MYQWICKDIEFPTYASRQDMALPRIFPAKDPCLRSILPPRLQICQQPLNAVPLFLASQIQSEFPPLFDLSCGATELQKDKKEAVFLEASKQTPTIG